MKKKLKFVCIKPQKSLWTRMMLLKYFFFLFFPLVFMLQKKANDQCVIVALGFNFKWNRGQQSVSKLRGIIKIRRFDLFYFAFKNYSFTITNRESIWRINRDMHVDFFFQQFAFDSPRPDEHITLYIFVQPFLFSLFYF